jgi:membrane-bound metal-dependent hydrolase YbcI (DUF457 family)
MRLDFHLIVGLLLGAIGYYFFGLGFGFIVAVVFGAFIPDMDVVAFFFKKFLHRKLLHNIWFMILLSALVYLTFNNVFLSIGIIIGFASHILADSFTFYGTFPLYPFRKERKTSLANLSLQDKKEIRIERIIEIIAIVLVSAIFYIKGLPINIFTVLGISVIIFLIIVAETNRTGIWTYRKAGKYQSQASIVDKIKEED